MSGWRVRESNEELINICIFLTSVRAGGEAGQPASIYIKPRGRLILKSLRNLILTNSRN